MNENQNNMRLRDGFLAGIRRVLGRVRRRFSGYRRGLTKHRLLGGKDTHWARVVMDRETTRFVNELAVSSLSALEISGSRWQNIGFRSYESVAFPGYDVCEKPYKVEKYDVIFAEQVFEHLLWPYRAVRNIFEMLKPKGIFILTTPFLLKVHNVPVDCSRWTELGLKHLLAEGGFGLDLIQTGSWGNRACVRANFKDWVKWIPLLNSLENEPDFPVVVWAFAKKHSNGDISHHSESLSP